MSGGRKVAVGSGSRRRGRCWIGGVGEGSRCWRGSKGCWRG